MTEPGKRPAALIVGAKSDIARALAHSLAAAGHVIHLAARDGSALQADMTDIKLRYGVDVQVHDMDITRTDKLKGEISALDPQPRIIVSMVGFMGEQAEQQADPAKAAAVISTNFAGPAALMEVGAELFENLEEDTWLVGVSSVAGDRGRARNYYYGAAKAGFTAMMSGLRQRLAKSRVTVITVKPGFVATKATEDMGLSGPLVASAETCAGMIHRAIRKKREVVYPVIWRGVMTAVRAIPEPIFKRMKF